MTDPTDPFAAPPSPPPADPLDFLLTPSADPGTAAGLTLDLVGGTPPADDPPALDLAVAPPVAAELPAGPVAESVAVPPGLPPTAAELPPPPPANSLLDPADPLEAADTPVVLGPPTGPAGPRQVIPVGGPPDPAVPVAREVPAPSATLPAGSRIRVVKPGNRIRVVKPADSAG